MGFFEGRVFMALGPCAVIVAEWQNMMTPEIISTIRIPGGHNECGGPPKVFNSLFSLRTGLTG